MNHPNKKILIVTSSLFTNRILNKNFIYHLSNDCKIFIWAKTQPVFIPNKIKVESLPKIKSNSFILDICRRINTLTWARRKNIKSILSQYRFNKLIYGTTLKDRFFWSFSFVFSFLRLEKLTERAVYFLCKNTTRSIESKNRLKKMNPDLILFTNPFWSTEASIAWEAKKLNIIICTLIPSWDHITTKSRLTFLSNYYFVWSSISKKKIMDYYPQLESKNIFTYGTPQYEVFGDDEYYMNKETFFHMNKLDINKKVILYVLGSPNFIKTEYEGAIKMIEIYKQDKRFQNYQLIIRPHPNKDNNELYKYNNPQKGIVIQKTQQQKKSTINRNLSIEEIKIWVNTFRYCDVLINLSSTSIFDAIYFNKPVLNINFDPGGYDVYQEMIKDVNLNWEHLQEVNQCDGIEKINNFDDLIEKVLKILSNNISIKRAKENEKLFISVCGHKDLKNSKLLADKLILLTNKIN